MVKEIKVAVAGQPNVGKSTLFNVLTGRHVIVANWPGVTIERHEGWREYKGYRIHFIDLPGIYGFSASTIEELIARRFILSGEPDVLLVLVDSTMPERTMYLALEALEMFPKTIIVFTKSDLTHSHGIHINYNILSRVLGVPVVAVSAALETGIDELLDTIVKVYEGKLGRREPLRIDYGDLEVYVRDAEKVLRGSRLSKKYPLRWLALRILQGDDELEAIMRSLGEDDLVKAVMEIRSEIERIFKRRCDELFAQIKFARLTEIMSSVVVRAPIIYRKVYERLEKIFVHPFIGPLASLTLLVMVFTIVFTINTGFPLNTIFYALGFDDLGEAIEEYSLSGLLGKAFELLGESVSDVLSGFPEWFRDLVVDGIIGGIGAVLVFLPLIFLVALFLAILEDSGLAPRIAMSVHMIFQKIGLSGHATFPILLGLGCNVPSVMALRSIPNFRERVRLFTTIPFIPCQARLVVVLAIASALKGIGGVLLVILSYIIAFSIFSILNKLLYLIDVRRRVTEEPELLLEIPPIHRPLAKVVWWLTWDSVKHFIVKAGTIIFLVSVLSWFMLNYTPDLVRSTDPSGSIGAYIARAFSPILAPMGFSGEIGWMIAYALIVGFLAKEAVISALTILTGSYTIVEAIDSLGLSTSQIISLTIFSILYVPCAATLATVYMESRSVRITLATMTIMIVVAYVSAIVAYGIASIIIP